MYEHKWAMAWRLGLIAAVWVGAVYLAGRLGVFS